MCAVSASMLDENSLVIAISDSGATREILDAVTIARKNRVAAICLTTNRHSPLARMCDDVLITASSGMNISERSEEVRLSQYLIEYGKIKRQKGTGSIRVLIENRIIKFTLISVITGVVRTTVVFWLPTYISQYLGYSTEQSALIYTAATLVISFTTFVAVFLYELLRRNMDLTILIAFVSAAACFMPVYLFKHPVFNIVFMILAIMSSNTASTMLWSRYCPGLRDTGMVSSATGFLDFMSYMAASISSTLFANAVSDIGWGNLILVWFGLMLIGVLVAIPHRKRVKNPT